MTDMLTASLKKILLVGRLCKFQIRFEGKASEFGFNSDMAC
ncbi:hypothetical protein FHS68_004676 [Dyadobacter arcticus]|uniref:Uncharacterized protein n=1 Tax=Dyadobacter arcticus TaxID=1078754 RepID=A0ABX0UR79_9BACT|nr:hypothetical protein [Dyadobacter arcticus]